MGTSAAEALITSLLDHFEEGTPAERAARYLHRIHELERQLGQAVKAANDNADREGRWKSKVRASAQIPRSIDALLRRHVPPAELGRLRKRIHEATGDPLPPQPQDGMQHDENP